MVLKDTTGNHYPGFLCPFQDAASYASCTHFKSVVLFAATCRGRIILMGVARGCSEVGMRFNSSFIHCFSNWLRVWHLRRLFHLYFCARSDTFGKPMPQYLIGRYIIASGNFSVIRVVCGSSQWMGRPWCGIDLTTSLILGMCTRWWSWLELNIVNLSLRCPAWVRRWDNMAVPFSFRLSIISLFLQRRLR
jgi:hypothetical protein